MIDVRAEDFDIGAIDLSTVTSADIVSILGKNTTEEQFQAWRSLQAAARENKRRANNKASTVSVTQPAPVSSASSAASAATPSRPLPVAPPPPPPKPSPAAIAAGKAAGAAEERRCHMILARAPDSMRNEALAAIKAGHSLEQFDASIPAALKHYMPPLAASVANFALANSAKTTPKQNAAAEDEAASQSILRAHRAANAHALPRRS